MVPEKLFAFATGYTAAWGSREPARVASFFSPAGTLTINDGTPSVGRAAITAVAQSFMTALPDLSLRMDRLIQERSVILYHWTLWGTNTGPGGSHLPVRISGHEEWRLGRDGLIADSQGRFDAADYERQLTPSP